MGLRTRYQVVMLDTQGTPYGAHDMTGVEQLRYSKRIGDIGRFLMTLPLRDADLRMLQKDSLAWVFRTDPLTGALKSDGIYFLRYYDTEPGDSGDALILEGYSPEHLLARRVYDPEDDPQVANGYSTKAGPCATIMREIVYEQCINPAYHTERGFLGLTAQVISSDNSPYAAFRKEIADAFVIEALQELRDAHGIDFWVDLTGFNTTYGYPEFEFRFGLMGCDRSKLGNPDGPYVYLTPSAGHLYAPKLTMDAREETNMVYVLGKGANGNRLVYRQGASSVSSSPFNRIEIAVDGSQADTLDQYLTAANDALEKGRSRVLFTFEPSSVATGAIYEQDWDLGYTVTVGHHGVELTMRVLEVEITVTAEGETIKVETELVDDAELQTFMETNKPDVWDVSGFELGGGNYIGQWGGLLSLPHFNELWQWFMTKTHGSWKNRIRQAARRFSLSRSEIAGALEKIGVMPTSGQPGRMVTLEVNSDEEPDTGYLMIDAGPTWRTPGIVHVQDLISNPANITINNADWDKEDETLRVSYTPKTSRIVVEANFLAQRQVGASSNGFIDIGYYDAESASWVRAGDTDYGLAQTLPGSYLQYHLQALFTGLTPGATYTFYIVGKSGGAYGNRYSEGCVAMRVRGD